MNENQISTWPSQVKAFAQKVRDLRDAQKTYFRDRTPSSLQRAMQLERELDRELAEMDQRERADEGQLAMDFDQI